MSGIDPISQQRLNELAGAIGAKASGKAAVRKSDLSALVSLPVLTSAQETGDSVTVDDYNALQADVAALFAALQRVGVAVKS